MTTGAEPEVAVSAHGLTPELRVRGGGDARSISTVARGEIFGLVGPDGAGKSTIMRMLAGVMRPDAGDDPPGRHRRRRRAGARPGRISATCRSASASMTI